GLVLRLLRAVAGARRALGALPHAWVAPFVKKLGGVVADGARSAGDLRAALGTADLGAELKRRLSHAVRDKVLGRVRHDRPAGSALQAHVAVDLVDHLVPVDAVLGHRVLGRRLDADEGVVPREGGLEVLDRIARRNDVPADGGLVRENALLALE